MLFLNFFLSVLLWAFIGLERDLPSQSENKSSDFFWWMRSFAIISLLWAISVFIDSIFGYYFFSYFTLWLIGIFILISYIYSSFKKDAIWLTSEYAAIATYFVWVLVMMEKHSIALVFTILLTIILSSKDALERFKSTISREELKHTLTFAVVAFVVLPLLPDEKFSFATLFASMWFSDWLAWKNGIWQVLFFNPYSLWFFVVVMSAVGYVGYMLSKYLGTKSSIIVSSIVGGLVSSTAVTAAMTEQSQKDKTNYSIYIVGTLLANSIMLARVIFIVLLFNIVMLKDIFIPVFMMFIWLASATYYFYVKGKTALAKKTVNLEWKMKSPFSIAPALKFWAFVLMIKFIAAVGLLYKDIWGENVFYYLLWIISWLADVDAITQTMAVQASDMLVPSFLASVTIILASISNNVVKGTIAYKFWEVNFWKGIALSFIFSMILWIIGLWISFMV